MAGCYYVTKRIRLGEANYIYVSSCNNIPHLSKLDDLGHFNSPFRAMREAKEKGYRQVSVCPCSQCQNTR